jgi:hypothetical protein
MSEIRVNNITNREGSAGPSVAGIPVVDSTSHFVVPTGRTGQRYADGGENIVRDGLVLYLDAKYSYPGASGTNPDTYTWYDLSGNENHGELKNGVSYSETGGGSLVFDGVNDYVTLSSPLFNIFSTISIFSFIRFNTTSESCQIFDTRDSSGDGLSFLMSNPTGNVLYSSLNSSNIAGTTTIQSGVIYYVGLTYDGSTAKLYLNANEDNSKSITETFNVTANPTIAVRTFSIGSASYGRCNIYSTKVYNKALTAQEVLQNFNATRSRYGI